MNDKKKKIKYQKTVPAGTVLEDSNQIGKPGLGIDYSIAKPKKLSRDIDKNLILKPVELPATEVAGALGASPKGDKGILEQVPRAQRRTISAAGRSVLSLQCPYCQSQNFVKRGTRLKKSGKTQLYLCRACRRSFTPAWTKGRQHSWQVILDAISYYNLGFSLEQTGKVMKEKFGVEIMASTLSAWLDKYGRLCAYKRMRPFGLKMYSPYDIIETCTLAHRQLYRFRYHRAKTRLILIDDFKHAKFQPMKEFLDNVTAETPHQYFQQGERMSEAGTNRNRNKGKEDKGTGNFGTRDLRSTPDNLGSGMLRFSKTEMIVRAKKNYATALAGLVFQGVSDNKQRHEALQKFFIANDSVTVATEVPVYIRRDDLTHMQTQLGFKLYKKVEVKNSKSEILNSKQSQNLKSQIQNNKNAENKMDYELLPEDEIPKLITGHIDFLQIRNGAIHILDYKGGGAAKERPIEQLTLYALALSRLTGLRLFHFKCAWFDENDYFEFFPLHVVYKRSHSRRRIKTIEGVYNLNEQINRIENLRPMA